MRAPKPKKPAPPSKNYKIALAFASQFKPPLNVVSTRRINSMPIADAWMMAAHDDASGYGITAHAFDGKLHAFIEKLDKGTAAEDVGKQMAKWFKAVRGG